MLRIVIFGKMCCFGYLKYLNYFILEMSALGTLKQLKVDSTLISYPFSNPQSQNEPIDDLLVEIDTESAKKLYH